MLGKVSLRHNVLCNDLHHTSWQIAYVHMALLCEGRAGRARAKTRGMLLLSSISYLLRSDVNQDRVQISLLTLRLFRLPLTLKPLAAIPV
jgi:hypothetical protein